MFLATKLLRVGIKQAKKHNAAKKAAQQSKNQSPWPEAPYYNHYNGQPYPPDQTNNMHIPMPSSGTTFPTPFPPQTPPPSNSKTSKLKTYAEGLLRLLQFALGLAVIGLYGQDIKPTADKSDSRWVYAVVVGFLGSVTGFVYLMLDLVVWRNRVPLRERGGKVLLGGFVWECILVVNWLTVFGIFGKVFLGRDDGKEGDGGNGDRMRRAVYLDVVVLVLWVGSAAVMGMRWLKKRRVGNGGDNGDGEKGVEM